MLFLKYTIALCLLGTLAAACGSQTPPSEDLYTDTVSMQGQIDGSSLPQLRACAKGNGSHGYELILSADPNLCNNTRLGRKNAFDGVSISINFNSADDKAVAIGAFPAVPYAIRPDAGQYVHAKVESTRGGLYVGGHDVASGSAQLDVLPQNSATVLSGSLALVWDNGEQLAGQFTAPLCTMSAVLPAVQH